jgi:HK97 family phage prohead protease
MPTETATTLRIPMKATFTAADDPAKPGAFRALVSAYDVKYRIGYALWHTIEMGAFKTSIAEQTSIPIFWMHSWDWSEQMPIGAASAEESTGDGGLVLDGRLYVDIDPSIARLYQAMREDAIREWSIGYSVLALRTDPDDQLHEFVTEAELLEGSSVLRGANPDTRTLEVASAPGDRSRITTSSGVVVETADRDLIAQLTATPAAAPPEKQATTDPDAFDTSSLLAQSKVREMFGSTALAD